MNILGKILLGASLALVTITPKDFYLCEDFEKPAGCVTYEDGSSFCVNDGRFICTPEGCEDWEVPITSYPIGYFDEGLGARKKCLDDIEDIIEESPVEIYLKSIV